MILPVESCHACGSPRCAACEVHKQMRWQCTSDLLPCTFTTASPRKLALTSFFYHTLTHTPVDKRQQLLFDSFCEAGSNIPSSHFPIHGHHSSTATLANFSTNPTPDSNSPKKYHRVPSSKWHFRTLDMRSSSNVLLSCCIFGQGQPGLASTYAWSLVQSPW